MVLGSAGSSSVRAGHVGGGFGLLRGMAMPSGGGSSELLGDKGVSDTIGTVVDTRTWPSLEVRRRGFMLGGASVGGRRARAGPNMDGDL